MSNNTTIETVVVELLGQLNPTNIEGRENESYDEWLDRVRESMTDEQWDAYCEYWGL